MPDAQPPGGRGDALPLALVALALALLSILLDSQTRFHLGDAETFLNVALPVDRPWIYAQFAQRMTELARDISIIPKLQVTMAAGGGFVLGLALMRRFGLSWRAGAVPVVVVLAEPLSFWWARSVMTDTMATAGLCLVLAAAIWPALRPAPRFALVFLAALLTMFARSVHTVPLAATGLGFIVLTWAGGRMIPPLAGARPLALSVGLALAAALPAFAVANTWALRQAHGNLPVALNHESSRFLLGGVSPLLEAQRNLIPLPEAERAALPPFTRENRLWHTFGPTGLVESLARAHGREAEAQGLRLAREAVLGSPLAMVRLTLENWGDYLNPWKAWRYHIRAIWSGAVDVMQPNRISPGVVERIRAMGIWQGVREDWPGLDSLALRWFRWGGGASALLVAWAATLSLPLVLLTRLRRVPEAWLAAGLATAMTGFMALTVNEYVSRYLIAILPALLVMALAWRGGAAGSAEARGRPGGQPG